MWNRGFWFVVALVTALSCMPDLERTSEVTKLRLLGVAAEPPEIAPGGATRIRVLTADPEGAGRRISVGGMVAPGVITPEASASQEEGLPLFFALPFTAVDATGTADFPELTVPAKVPVDGALVDVAPPGEPLALTAILIACAGDGFDGALALSTLAELMQSASSASSAQLSFEDVCTRAGGDEGIAAFKTFDVATCDPATSTLDCASEFEPNANPEIASLAVGGQPLAQGVPLTIVCGAEDGCRDPVPLSALLAADSFQKYERPIAVNDTDTVLVYERTYISWFADGGSFDRDRSGNASTQDAPRADDPFEVNWTPDYEGGTFTLWAVAHDVRGGVSWKRYSIQALIGI